MTDAPERRMCPGCQSAMQAFRARGVTIERCLFCGGMWFDGGELERVLGAKVPVAPSGAGTTRRCARCTVTMEGASLRGIPVEVCRSCQSVYLDDGELQQLAGQPVALEQAQPPRVREGLTFVCRGCGEEIPMDEGVTTATGMACSRCFGMLDGSVGTVTPVRSSLWEAYPGQWGRGAPMGPNVDLIASTLFRLFGL